MSKSVWIIEDGEYSDYRVVGIYSTRENAERVAAKMNEGRSRDLATVAERRLDPGIEALNEGLMSFRVLMLRDGTVESVEPRGEAWSWGDLEDEAYVWSRSKTPSGRPDVLYATVWAKGEKHAVKIVNEKRAQVIASGEWD